MSNCARQCLIESFQRRDVLAITRLFPSTVLAFSASTWCLSLNQSSASVSLSLVQSHSLRIWRLTSPFQETRVGDDSENVFRTNMWDPHSYVSEVVGAARHRNAPLFTTTRETVFEKQQHSKLLSESLNEEHEEWRMYTMADGSDCDLHIYVNKGDTLSAQLLDSVKTHISATWRSVSDCEQDYGNFLDAAGAQSSASGEILTTVAKQCFLANAIAQHCVDHGKTALVIELPLVTAVLSGAVWTAGIKGIPFCVEDEEILTHLFSLSGPAKEQTASVASFLVSARLGNAADTAAEPEYALSVAGSDPVALLQAISGFCDALATDIGQFIMRLSLDAKLQDFFCVCSDGTETNREAALELHSLKVQGSGQVWNERAHAEKCVRVGNTADAMHLLERGNRNHAHSSSGSSLATLLSNLVARSVPIAHVVISVRATNGDVISQLLGSFQRVDRETQCGCVSIPRSSPLFNYFASPSAKPESGISVVFLGKTDVDKYCSAGTTQWSQVADCTVLHQNESTFYVSQLFSAAVLQSAQSFTVSHAHEIGDCVVFLGNLVALDPERHRSVVLLQDMQELRLCTTDVLVAPILCTMVHRLFGKVGVVASAMTVCSSSPPCLLLNVPGPDSGRTLDENGIDPNITIYTFRRQSSLFDGRAYSSVISDLPFPVIQLSDPANRDELQHEVHCRLIRVEPYGSNGGHICILSVSRIVGAPDACKTLLFHSM